MRRATGSIAAAVLAAAVLAGGGSGAGGQAPKAGRAGAPPVGGPFQLVDGAGQAVTDAAYRGKYLLISFGYTHCPDICPTVLLELSMVLDALGADVGKVQSLFITVDPERDSPRVLADYVANFHSRITGLTGTPDQVAAAAAAYRTRYRKVPLEGGGYVLDHSAITFLMAPDGRYLTHFAFGIPPEIMARRIKDHF